MNRLALNCNLLIKRFLYYYCYYNIFHLIYFFFSLIMKRKIVTKRQRMASTDEGLFEIERFKKCSKTFIIKNNLKFIDFFLTIL